MAGGNGSGAVMIGSKMFTGDAVCDNYPFHHHTHTHIYIYIYIYIYLPHDVRQIIGMSTKCMSNMSPDCQSHEDDPKGLHQWRPVGNL